MCPLHVFHNTFLPLLSLRIFQMVPQELQDNNKKEKTRKKQQQQLQPNSPRRTWPWLKMKFVHINNNWHCQGSWWLVNCSQMMSLSTSPQTINTLCFASNSIVPVFLDAARWRSIVLLFLPAFFFRAEREEGEEEKRCQLLARKVKSKIRCK